MSATWTSRTCADTWSGLSGRSQSKKGSTSQSSWPTTCLPPSGLMGGGWNRCSEIYSPTPSSSPSTAACGYGWVWRAGVGARTARRSGTVTGPAVRVRSPAGPADNSGDLPAPAGEVRDDRSAVRQGDRVLLIVENDPKFAAILLDAARERGFKGVVARRGETALALARRFPPDAITLDLRLPDTDGWEVLDQFKNDLTTRHIPVHIISVEDGWQRG